MIVVYSEFPNSGCIDTGLEKIAESDTSLNDVKEICSKDFSCVGFYGILDQGWTRGWTLGWQKCGPTSERGRDPETTLYVKSIVKHNEIS